MIRKSLITLNDPKSPVSEAYRMIRTNLEYTNIDKKNKTILFTSSKTKEGKSTTIVNLALTIANNNKKVILIDCDLRKPRIHKLFKLSNNKGVSSIIIKQDIFNEVIQPISEVPGLHILTSGPIPPMPSELISSERMNNLLQNLKEHFDYILIDAPPLLSVTDETILSRSVDR